MDALISILITGSEVIDGRVQDTNANFIAGRLNDEGLQLLHFLACDDRLESITRSIGFLLENSNYLIISGGIGPTTDDLTREAVAAFSGKKLLQDEGVLQSLKERYAKRNRIMDPTNAKQALFPDGATPIPNPLGTAAGFSLTFKHKGEEKTLFILPGVPFELKEMFEQSVLPTILKDSTVGGPVKKSGFRVFGIPESTVGRKISELNLSSSIEISYRASFPEIHVLFKTRDTSVKISDVAESAIQAVGEDSVFSRNIGQGLPALIHHLLTSRGETLSVGESCTSGMIGALLTDLPGASSFFLGGGLTYSNDSKTKLLNVAPQSIKEFGAVSYEVAREMAYGTRLALGGTYGLSITGVLGPDGGSKEKPVGLYYVGFSSSAGTESYRFFFNTDRARNRSYAAYNALDVLRRKLLGLPIREYSPEK